MTITRSLTILAGLCLLSGSAQAVTFHSANSSTSTLTGGDRQLNSLGFAGSSTVYGNSNFLNFNDGQLVNNVGTYGWMDPIPRDMGPDQGAYSANPDRGDSASAFVGEGSGTGTLKEVFGANSSGYKNMSWIIDGEDDGSYTLDLLFGGDKTLNGSGDPNFIDIAILERGGNSDFNIYGLLAGGGKTAALYVDRTNMGSGLWNLNTVEIGDDQPVTGVGISLDSSWQNLIGFRIENIGSSFNGPDIVAVGTAAPHNAVPEPGTVAMLSSGLIGASFMAIRRRARVRNN